MRGLFGRYQAGVAHPDSYREVEHKPVMNDGGGLMRE